MVLATHVRQFDTYGDGDTQHSLAYTAPVSNAYDFLLSVLAVLGDDTQCDQETVEFLKWELGFPMRKMKDEEAAFLRSIRHDAEKRRWFSLEDKKVSASESKRYDKRWFEVPDWADGRPGSVLGLWNLAHNGPSNSFLEWLGLWITACGIEGGYLFAEHKVLQDAFGEHAELAARLFETARDLIETRNALLWQASRARSFVTEATKTAEPAAQAA